MNKLFSKKLWFVLSVVLATLLVISIVVTQVAYDYAPLLNSTFGLKNYEIVDDGTGEGKITYEADLTTRQEIFDAGFAASKEVEAEGLVLLTNDGALPLSKSSKVSLFGTGSVYINSSVQGIRNASDKTDVPTLRAALEGVGITVNETLWNFYETGAGSSYGGSKRLDPATNLQTYYINEVPWSAYDGTVTRTFSEYGDAAIVVLTRDSTEGSDVNAAGSDGIDGNYLALSQQEHDLLEQLTALKRGGTFKSIIVLLNGSQPLQMDFLYESSIDVDACMWIGNTGMSGIHAVAEALVGDVIPSGRLTDTYVKDNFSSPAMASWVLNQNRVFSNSWNDDRLGETQKYYGVYVEGIYVGYRYYETRYADVVEGRPNVGDFDYMEEMAFPFGYGLSYTEFAYSDFSVQESEDGKSYDISVTVTNIGDTYAGKEVVQVYLQKPYTEYAEQYGIEVAAVELVGFAKTGELAPGGGANSSETVTISVEKQELTSYDVYGAGTYILDAGDYYFSVGKDSHSALNNILAEKGYTEEDGMDAAGDAQLAYAFNVAERDTQTYSVSAETGNPITNQLADLDPNRYVGGGNNYVTYVSRSNWTGTWPTQAATLTLTEQMVEDLQSDKPVESEGEMPAFGVDSGMTLSMMYGKEFEDADWQKVLDQMTFEELNTLLSTCYCKTPAIESIVKPETNEMDGPTYCKESDNGVRFPCEGIWAASFNTELLTEIGRVLANDALSVGYNGMWIPGINIHRTPYCGRYHEYFSEDPFLTGKMAEAEIWGIQEYGVIAYPKHYAFNDQEANRNGITTWLNEQAAREIYLEPWKHANGAGRGEAHGVMSSFNRVGCVWSSAHKGLITDILRGEFGFDGFIITDMADANGTEYMSCLDGIVAGTDTWLSSGKNHSFMEYRDNATVVNAMRDAAHRVLYSVANFNAAMDGYSSSTRQVRVYVWWEITLITAVTVCSVLTAGSVVMLILSKKRRASE